MLSKAQPFSLNWVSIDRSTWLRFTLLGLLFTCASNSSAGQSSVSIGEPGSWVMEANSTDHEIKVSKEASNGVFYRLFDKQINTIDVDDRSNYTKIEYEYTNKLGVQDRSTITIDFDPNYESIVFHQLGIVRDGVYIDKLPTTELQVLRTEEELDDLFYNGTETLTAILEDTRVGDILRYSYTRHGENPVFDNLIEYTAYPQHTVPMAVASYRLLASEDQPLYIRKRDTTDSIIINQTAQDGVQQISWSQKNLTPTKWVDDEPSWSQLKPSFVVSSAKNWKDIVDWSRPKYEQAMATSKSPELTTVAESIQRRHSTKAGQVGAALRWAQDEIRYFGVELGDNSHNPSTPDETLANRFGDCKDKTVLLIALLGKLGIDAQPALVNTKGMLRNDKYPFRLHAFNHVIVHIRINGQTHWIDPTRQNQQGALGEFYEPNYGKALIIADGQTALTDMSMQYSEYKRKIKKKYELDKNNTGHANLKILTQRRGLTAETFRNTISDHGLSGLKSDYVDYYRDQYNYLESAGDIEYTELPKNASNTVEHYKLEDFWTEYEDGTRGFDLVSDETRRYLDAPKAPKYRTRPYALGYPTIITEVNVIKFDRPVINERAKDVITNDYFTYTVKVDQDAKTRTLTISHTFESHALSIPPEDIVKYTADVDEAWDISSIYIPDSGIDWSDDETESNDPLTLLVGAFARAFSFDN